jgi:hypothetical protein
MTSAQHQFGAEPDRAAAGRAVGLAVAFFVARVCAAGDVIAIPAGVITKLREAATLIGTLAGVGDEHRHEIEQSVVQEFLFRVELALDQALADDDRGAALLRHARDQLTELFPARN